MDWSLFGKPTFSDWIYTGAFADTRERGGFEKSELPGDSSEDVPSAGVEEWAGIELSPSAARLGEMQGVLIPAVKCAFGSRTGWAPSLPSPSSGTPTCSRWKRVRCISNLSTGRRSGLSSRTRKRE